MDYKSVIDIDSAKERFLENEDLYKKFLYKLPDDPLMENLETHLEENNIEAAFRDAHTMKGVVGNLSLNRLMKAASVVTEKLRAKEMPLESEMDELREAHKLAVTTVNEIKAADEKLF